MSFNPRLPRGKATSLGAGKLLQSMVSIHAFREGRRRTVRKLSTDVAAVSIHAFREGRRRTSTAPCCRSARFQSTPSAREGDTVFHGRDGTTTSFNPRLPRGKATGADSGIYAYLCVSIHAFREGRRLTREHRERGMMVSIHAFREGRRPSTVYYRYLSLPFQSTPSAREGDDANAFV